MYTASGVHDFPHRVKCSMSLSLSHCVCAHKIRVNRLCHHYFYVCFVWNFRLLMQFYHCIFISIFCFLRCFRVRNDLRLVLCHLYWIHQYIWNEKKVSCSFDQWNSRGWPIRFNICSLVHSLMLISFNRHNYFFFSVNIQIVLLCS